LSETIISNTSGSLIFIGCRLSNSAELKAELKYAGLKLGAQYMGGATVLLLCFLYSSGYCRDLQKTCLNCNAGAVL